MGSMTAQLAADVVLLIHFAFVVFVVAGGFLVLHWPRLAWLHLPAACWGVLIEYFGWICPLTPLEQHLRSLAGQTADWDSLVEHYFLPLLYPAELTRPLQIALGSLVLLLNLTIYGVLLHRLRKTRPSQQFPD